MLDELTIWDAAAVTAKLLAYSGCFISVGSTLYLLATPGLPSIVRHHLKNIAVTFAVVGAVGSFIQLGVQSGMLLDEGIPGMFDSEMLTLVTESPLGTSVLLRMAGLLAIVIFAFSTSGAGVIGTSGTVITACAFSFVGHGTGEPRILMGALVTTHVLGISFWLGALWPLHLMTSTRVPTETLGALAHRFGQQAAWVVGLLFLAGSFLVYRIVGSIHELITSQYGLTLLGKLAIVSTLLLLAAANKLRIVPSIICGDQSAPGRLRRSITTEMTFFVVILTIAAVLTTITPLPDNGSMSHD